MRTRNSQCDWAGRLGNPEATDEEVKQATKAANAYEFIKSFPSGFATRVGAGGGKLSGGQKQRVAIARAILRDPGLMILDEATSMYDLESEAAFIESSLETLSDRTVIIITHRPASLALADRVCELNKSEAKQLRSG